MTKINLRDYYPFYSSDIYIDIPDEVAAVLTEEERREEAYRRRMYRYKAQYSLNRDDGIEHDICFVSMSPCELYERKMTAEQLHTAIAALPDKQGKRICAHYILGISQASIARAEGVSKMAVCSSILRGLKQLDHILKNLLD
jgi:RNA polymerase sigma-70 factor (ECF subfamily)